jgi:ABC-type sugar transport system substrate-binding protein
VVGMDTDQRTLEWIQQGLIKATIAQKPFTMAYTGLRMLADLTKYPPQRYHFSPLSKKSLNIILALVSREC